MRPHVEPCRGSSKSNVDYCRKWDTRKTGTEAYTNGVYEAYAAAAQTQGQRTDLLAVQTAIDDGASLADIIKDHFTTWAKYDRFLRQYHTDHTQSIFKQTLITQTSGTRLRDWQTKLLDSLVGDPLPRKVRWWWEDRGNVGKSFMGKSPPPAPRGHRGTDDEEGGHVPPTYEDATHDVVRRLRLDEVTRGWGGIGSL